MPDTSFPSVTIEEEQTAVHGIVSVPSATAAFVGFAAKGPAGAPITVESLAQYEAAFGNVPGTAPLSTGVAAFFQNGGAKAVIVRAGPASALARAPRHYHDLIGTPQSNTGLYALNLSREILGLLVLPDAAYLPVKQAAEVIAAASSFAQKNRMFYLGDVPNSVASVGIDAAIQWANAVTERSTHMAVYYPWLTTARGKAGKSRLVPPSSVAAGIYARLDHARGVWKVPAGQEAIAAGVSGLGLNVTDADSQKLQSAGINPIRKFTGNNIMLWGARTFGEDADREWQYVSVRRLALFIVKSVQNGLSWAVFEPNGEKLWSQIRLEISSFLHTAWQAGAFMGIKPQDAYFVKCDATTMTQADIDAGRLIVLIGFAPLRPAEFVIVRIQVSADAT